MGWTDRAHKPTPDGRRRCFEGARSDEAQQFRLNDPHRRYDIGKNTFHLVGMDACAGAHFLSRVLSDLTHEARLMPARYVKPFLKDQKNTFQDAAAIAEAVQRPSMRCVPTMAVDQLDLQALHRVPSRLVRQHTAVINQFRSLLLERGIAVRQGYRSLRLSLPVRPEAPTPEIGAK